MEIVEQQYRVTEPPESFEVLQSILKAQGQKGSERLVRLKYRLGDVSAEAHFNPSGSSFFDSNHQEVFTGSALVLGGKLAQAGAMHVYIGAADESPAHVAFIPQDANRQQI